MGRCMCESGGNTQSALGLKKLRIRNLVRPISRFFQDYEGVAALEFALLVPMMLALYLGAVEISQALTIDRRVTALTSAAGDLVAQTERVNDHDLLKIYDLSKTILYPYDTSPLSLTITSIVADEKNKTTIKWSKGLHGGAAHGAEDAYALPGKLTHAYSSVIMVEAVYRYTSPFGAFITGPISMTDRYFLRPRKSLEVEKTN